VQVLEHQHDRRQFRGALQERAEGVEETPAPLLGRQFDRLRDVGEQPPPSVSVRGRPMDCRSDRTSPID